MRCAAKRRLLVQRQFSRLSLGISFALMQFGQTYATYALVAEPGSLPAPRTIVTVLGQGWVAAIVIVPFLFLLFPEGHLPSRRWRHGTSAEVISALIDPGITAIFAAIVISAASLVFRYHRASGIQRQQIKWFAYAAALNAFLVAIDMLGLTDLLLGYPLGNSRDVKFAPRSTNEASVSLLRFCPDESRLLRRDLAQIWTRRLEMFTIP